MRDAAMTGSPRTTLRAGLALGMVALLELLRARQGAIVVTPDHSTVIGFSGPVAAIVSALLTLAGALILAFGVSGEAGLLRRSRAAGVALLVGAAADAALVIPSIARQAVAAADADLVRGAGFGIPLLDLVGTAALAVAALIVLRRRLLEPFARWALAVAAAAPLLVTLLTWIPVPAGLLTAASPLLTALSWTTGLAALAVAVGLLIHGRSRAIGERLRIIRRSW